MSMDSECLLGRGSYFHIAIFLNKILPKCVFFLYLQMQVLTETQPKVITMWWFYMGREDSYTDLFGGVKSLL